MCMMDTDLYFSEYHPEGTSIFSYPKIHALVETYQASANDLIFGYPKPDCGCFPGCHDFKIQKAHIKDFCCSDYEAECINCKSNISNLFVELRFMVKNW